ncbi:ATP-binding protein, partial [Streptomyces sp. SYSU K21746]
RDRSGLTSGDVRLYTTGELRPYADNRVYVAVIDRAPRQLPELCKAGPDDINGRGLALVEELADRWGYDLMGSGRSLWGKRVWAEMKVTR